MILCDNEYFIVIVVYFVDLVMKIFLMLIIFLLMGKYCIVKMLI